MEKILERYERYSYAERQLIAPESDVNTNWSMEYNRLKAKIELLERNQRHYLGEDLQAMSPKELQNLEQQLDTALKHIRSRKNQLMYDSVSELQRKCSFFQFVDDDENLSSSSSNLSRLDFKLRSFMDYGNYDGRDFTLAAKKPRASSSPLCQVYGCNMDLSSSKDYHKRHRVCETHSKSSMVIVNGIEQRFCQQCSRFHFLSEFDDGKRSCRRRLAGHNERRRKPSFYFLPGKQQKNRHKLVPQGNKFPGSFLYRVMDEQDHHRASRLVSFKDEPTCGAHSHLSAHSQQHVS
ncbi:hypothetical protein Rs2_39649 [Raphanus sativus]|nr:hypothetical protein Rs2_39649 [Raphanus sativus]